MPRRTSPLRLPSRLAVVSLSLIGPSSCVPPRNDTDADAASVDAVTDDLVGDGSACDGSPFAPGYSCLPAGGSTSTVTCPANRYCTTDMCPTGCVACATTQYLAGFQCVPDVHADVTVACGSNRVCNVSDCPVGCVGCAEPFFCLPDSPGPDGSTFVCTQSLVCNTTDCSAGCHAVG